MGNNISKYSQLAILDESRDAAISSANVPNTLVSMVQFNQLVTRVIRAQGSLQLYSIEGLAHELNYQSTLITQKGGITSEQKRQLRILTFHCMAELHAVCIKLNIRLQDILLT